MVVVAADICADGAPGTVVRAAVDRWGRLDVLVDNAGATAVMPLAEATAGRTRELSRLNITAPILLARAALPHLRPGLGASPPTRVTSHNGARWTRFHRGLPTARRRSVLE